MVFPYFNNKKKKRIDDRSFSKYYIDTSQKQIDNIAIEFSAYIFRNIQNNFNYNTRANISFLERQSLLSVENFKNKRRINNPFEIVNEEEGLEIVHGRTRGVY